MNSRASSAMLLVVLAGVAGNCSSNERSKLSGARSVVEAIGGQFQRVSPSALEPQAAPHKEPFFREPWKASFETVAQGELLAKSEEEAREGRNLSMRFPGTADGALKVSASSEVWVNERLVAAVSSARAEVLDGRVVYAGAKRGVDRVFEVTNQRVEEYLQLADERAAAELAWEVETGPGIAGLIVDGSGLGLVAIDAARVPVLKAPQPQGLDAQGAPVQGRLVAERLSEHRFTLRVVPTGQWRFPVLLDPSWVATGSMSIARQLHTATTLQNGKILVVGGLTPAFTASTELYDPATGTWSATGSLAATRYNHSATLLLDGKVLVAGGYDGPVIATAELYDPASGTWSVVAPMLNGRKEHTATLLLPSGRVLVAGGWNNAVGSHPNAEIYDPIARTWTPTAPMAAARYVHTATQLANGRVLVAGGLSANQALAEIYDPVSGAWAPTGPLNIGRYGHTANLLATGAVLVAGGWGPGQAFAELYSPATGTWTNTGPLTSPRSLHTSVLLPSGKVLAVGGYNATVPQANAELYDPGTGTWSATGSMAIARYYHTASLLQNGKVLITGGIPGPQASSELYLVLDGRPCAAAADCASGFCSSAVCCNSACGNACDSCNVTGNLGTCINTPAGSAGSPSCAPYSCSGSSPTCPASCTVDSQCVAGNYCNGSTCVPRKILGVTCAGANECVSANCIDGTCCNTTCAGNCNACNVAGSLGTCTNTPSGSAGSPACAPYLCSGTASACPASCTADSQCVAGQYCNGTACVPKKVPGVACTATNQCASGSCVNGVCCNTGCAGACDACNLPGSAGTCTNTPAGSTGAPSCAPYVCSGAAAACPSSCTADTQCVSGQYCNGTACVPKKVPGVACTATNQCASGSCVDGVCCNTACAGSCDACNLSGSVGTCANVAMGATGSPSCAPFLCSGTSANCPGGCAADTDCSAGQFCLATVCVPKQPPGISCSAGNSCLSANCVDGVCCDTGCAGACDSCNLVGLAGTCTNSPAGTTGNPTCSPYVCSGAAPGCPSSCTSDTECAAGQYCDGTSCVPKKVLGTACTAANACASSQCVDGACCDRACTGACDACNLTGTEGTCTAVPAGNAGTPACAPYVCSGVGVDCPTTCTDDTQCATGQYCDGTSCLPKKVPGATCSVAGSCLSGSCADGVCCDSDCTGACDACDLPGSGGTCSNAPAGEPGSPACSPYVCTGSASTCPSTCQVDAQCSAGTKCLSGTCTAPLANGGACTSNAQCSSALCVDGFCCNSACAGTCDVCNAAGQEGQCVFAPIATGGTPSCTPYICPGDSAVCPTGCVDDASCAAGNVCAAGECVAAASAPDGGTGPVGYAGWSCGCDAGTSSMPGVMLLALALFRSRRRR